MTTLEHERDEQRRWVLLPHRAHLTAFDRLVEGEFLSPERQAERQNNSLRRMVEFAAEQVPFYRALFERLHLKPADLRSVQDLPRLPILPRWDLIEHAEAMKARSLPARETIYSAFSSSGTTGRPTRVWMTYRSNSFYTLLRQRANRWRRLDPTLTMTEMRLSHTLPPRLDGTPCPAGGTVEWPHWRYEGKFFRTGPYRAIGSSNPMEKLIGWLREQRAGYLIAIPATLEEMAFASVDRSPCETIRALISTASQLLPTMRRRIERVFGVPVHESYGLNEIGTVATRCEADRFHVHAEHCLVEIVDEDGQPCAPGRRGRILVTGLTNYAMPLLRYDTDDTAEAVAGPCPCGRALPSFVGISGRRRRTAGLPPGTLELFIALILSLEKIPPVLMRDLRRYQVHQYRDGRFELRLVCTQPLDAEFHHRVLDAWSIATNANPATPLAIVNVDDIPLLPSGKRPDFTSDYFEDADAAGTVQPRESVGG